MSNIFKAKTTDTNEWVYGYFVKYPDGLTVIYVQDKWESFEVHEETVSRSVDAVDINGDPLFVNDMINDFGGGTRVPDLNHPDYDPQMAFPPTKVLGATKRIGIIVEDEGRVCIKTKEMSYNYNISKASPFNKMERIGNIYDDYKPTKSAL
ncbi:hypothetical protein [Tenacibaculum singaporense]|uniref:hypothetical protein n=1 Tax=Tenacibaculum singaporense TaxID=2358479 RepID=UPI000F66104F|nr:hypothetical protein [Tenacibaculum singaporense]